MREPGRRQLRMVRPHLDDLPPPEPPDGFGLRTYQPGDEATWAELMNTPGGLGQGWTAERARERLFDRPQFDPGILFFATSDAEQGWPVATACAWQRDVQSTDIGWLHMVCARPEFRGQGLGRLVSLAALRCFRERGYRQVELSTDDFRLAAIKSYLAMGFVPVYLPDPEGTDNHEFRWSALFTTILAPRPSSALVPADDLQALPARASVPGAVLARRPQGEAFAP